MMRSLCGILFSLLLVFTVHASAAEFEDEWSRLVDGYLLTPESDAANNALADYIQAYKLCDGANIQKQMDLMRKTIKEGWPESGDDTLSKILAVGAPAMQAVIEGNAKPMAKYPIQMFSLNTPVWDNAQIMALGRLFELEAARKFARADALGAADSLGQGLDFASRVADGTSPLINHMARIPMQRFAAEGLARIALSGEPNSELCNRIMKILEPHLHDSENVASAMELECAGIRTALENPLELINEIEGTNFDMVMRLQDANRDLDVVLSDADTLVALIPPFARGPFSPNGPKELTLALNPLHPAVKMLVPNCVEARSRELGTVTQIRLAWLGAAARAKFAEGGATLEAIKQISASSEAGVDPYTRTAMQIIQKENTLLIYSVGPDTKNDGGIVEFDATKGTTSPGDFVLRIPH